jgi:hypothetical protein
MIAILDGRPGRLGLRMLVAPRADQHSEPRPLPASVRMSPLVDRQTNRAVVPQIRQVAFGMIELPPVPRYVPNAVNGTLGANSEEV